MLTPNAPNPKLPPELADGATAPHTSPTRNQFSATAPPGERPTSAARVGAEVPASEVEMSEEPFMATGVHFGPRPRRFPGKRQDRPESKDRSNPEAHFPPVDVGTSPASNRRPALERSQVLHRDVPRLGASELLGGVQGEVRVAEHRSGE